MPYHLCSILSKTLFQHHTIAQASGLPCYCRVQLQWAGVPVEITVDWRQNSREKKTVLSYSGREILLHHTGQQLIDGNAIIDCSAMPRLPQHYFHYFTGFRGQSRLAQALQIHKVLFEVNQAL